MHNILFSRDDLRTLVNYLIKKMTVYGPVPKQNNFSFLRISSFDELIFDYTYTTLPPKKLLFPPRETMFRFAIENIEGVEPNMDFKDQCIIGIHPCDIHGISLMDRVFSSDYEDPYYMAKREKTILIGMDCMPDNECFCTSLHTDIVTSGFDLFMTPLHDKFVVNAGSKKGEDLIRLIGDVKTAGSDDMDSVRKYRETKKGKACKSIKADYRSLPLFYSGAFDLDVWGKYAERCFGCGSCIMVCPTCYCFNVEDNIDLNLKTGNRQRVWDGCMLSDFAKIGTGENFRKSLTDRLRHRFNRKFQFHTVKYGELFCVGCGRCARACLAEIKPCEVTNEIIEAKENEQKSVYSKTGEID